MNNNMMGDSNTILSALYRHLKWYCTHPLNNAFDKKQNNLEYPNLSLLYLVLIQSLSLTKMKITQTASHIYIIMINLTVITHYQTTKFYAGPN